MNRPATPPLSVNLLVALCVLNHVAMSGSRVALALHALRLGVPSLGLALMLAPYALTSALGALPIGRWVDRSGSRVPALAGMALASVGLAAAAWQPDRVVLTLVATLVGLGYTASVIALQSELARDRDAATRSTGFGRFAIGTAASGGFGPLLAGHCMAHGGARVTFGVLALVSFAAFGGGLSRARRLLSTRAPSLPPALFALTTLFRHRKAILGLVAGRDEVSGTVHFPPSRVSLGEAHTQDAQKPYKLAERNAKVLSFSAEYLSYHPSPPNYYGQVDFEGGGRILMEFTDVSKGDIETGSSMKMVFRIKDIDEKRGFVRYFWKATPARAAAQ